MTRPDDLLGPTLRAWRDRLRPPSSASAPVRGRRTVGLRREEVASRAAISVDYLSRLEQGRIPHPSRQVVDALSRALELNAAERQHLFQLSGLHAAPVEWSPDEIPPGFRRLLDRMGRESAVAVFAGDWQLLWWNEGWTALLGDPAVHAESARNFARDTFTAGTGARALAAWPVLSTDPEATRRAVVADLRAALTRGGGGARLQHLIDDLRETNAAFAELWDLAPVDPHLEERKTILHPHAGSITVDCDVVTYADGALKAVCLTTMPGSPDEVRYRSAVAGDAVTTSA